MIESKELRIGNYVKMFLGVFDNGAEYSIHTIEGIKNSKIKEQDTVQISKHDFWYSNYVISPIPLTKEILLKCGFEKTNRIDFGELKECYANFSFALMVRHNSFFVDWIGGNTEVKYLHILQNLFYALTGEELNITL
jgi:hypothetical protein